MLTGNEIDEWDQPEIDASVDPAGCGDVNQREIQVWNDAVEACRRAAWAEVELMEGEAENGMPSPARLVVRALGACKRQGDDRQKVVNLTADDFPKV